MMLKIIINVTDNWWGLIKWTIIKSFSDWVLIQQKIEINTFHAGQLLWFEFDVLQFYEKGVLKGEIYNRN